MKECLASGMIELPGVENMVSLTSILLLAMSTAWRSLYFNYRIFFTANSQSCKYTCRVIGWFCWIKVTGAIRRNICYIQTRCYHLKGLIFARDFKHCSCETTKPDRWLCMRTSERVIFTNDTSKRYFYGRKIVGYFTASTNEAFWYGGWIGKLAQESQCRPCIIYRLNYWNRYNKKFSQVLK